MKLWTLVLLSACATVANADAILDKHVNLGAGADAAGAAPGGADPNVKQVESLEKSFLTATAGGKKDKGAMKQIEKDENFETPREHVEELDGMEKVEDKAQKALNNKGDRADVAAAVGETASELTHGEIGLEKQYGIDSLPLVQQMNKHEDQIFKKVYNPKAKMSKVSLKVLREAVQQQKSDEEILKALEKAVEPSRPELVHAMVQHVDPNSEINTPAVKRKTNPHMRAPHPKQAAANTRQVMRLDANIDGESKASFSATKQLALRNSVALAAHEPVQNIEVAHVMEWSSRIVVELNIRVVDGPSTKVLFQRIEEFNFQPKVEVAFAKQVGPGVEVQFSKPFIVTKSVDLNGNKLDFFIPMVVGGTMLFGFVVFKALKQMNENTAASNVGLQRKYRSLDQSPQESDDC
jgi:hypothetical protein